MLIVVLVIWLFVAALIYAADLLNPECSDPAAAEAAWWPVVFLGVAFAFVAYGVRRMVRYLNS